MNPSSHLEVTNAERKQLLKEDKVRLAETYERIRQKAFHVNQGQ